MIPLVDEVYCSHFSRHMWSHTKYFFFKNKTKIYAWYYENMEVKVVNVVSIITAMKTMGTKDRSLYMAEHIDLFNSFHKQSSKIQKLTTY